MEDLKAPEKRFRPELEGVRVLAAFLVAVYHIWLGKVSGGVDVFFIVSGYLITTSLLSRIIREGTINILEYYLGLVRRLLPLALTVIGFIVVMSILVIPQARWHELIPELFATVFYYENWQLAFNTVDYLAQNNDASPFQHFWALSLQGQFYVTWPFIIFIAYFLARKLFKTPMRKTLLGLLVVLFIASLSYSIFKTNTNQPWAYFDSFARVWEFSLGGMLALLLPYLQFHKAVHIVIGWIGAAIIAFTGLLLPVSDVFPGYAALLPTTGVILVIVSAEHSSAYGVQRLLGSKPLLFLGSVSYGFYLWHWPLLIFYYNYFDVDSVSILHGLGIMGIAFVLSFLSSRLIETPIRKINVRKAKKRLAITVSCFLVPVVITGIFWQGYVTNATKTVATISEPSQSGAMVINPEENEDYTDLLRGDEELIPTTMQAPSDLAFLYDREECYSSTDEETLKKCSFGTTDDPDFIVALVGGSHSGHWFPALEKLAEDMNFQLDVYNRDACRFSTKDFDGKLSESCMEWNDNLVEHLMEEPPDVIFTTSTVAGSKSVPEGYVEMWQKFEGISHILAVRDNPRMHEKIPQCIEENGIEECAIPRSYNLADEIPWENTEGIPANVTFADLSDYFCDQETCYPVIGGVIVYRDEHHLTATYAETLAEPMRPFVEKAFGKIQ